MTRAGTECRVCVAKMVEEPGSIEPKKQIWDEQIHNELRANQPFRDETQNGRISYLRGKWICLHSFQY